MFENSLVFRINLGQNMKNKYAFIGRPGTGIPEAGEFFTKRAINQWKPAIFPKFFLFTEANLNRNFSNLNVCMKIFSNCKRNRATKFCGFGLKTLLRFEIFENTVNCEFK